MTAHHITLMFLSLGVLLGVARILGELAQRLRQPTVLGELLAGVLLGPSVLGSLAPEFSQLLFPPQGPNAIALDAITNLALVPFFVGFAAAWWLPQALGRQPDVNPLIFTLFLAIAMSISALPVIAKTLMDIDLYRSDLGMVVISAAIGLDVAVIEPSVLAREDLLSTGIGKGVAIPTARFFRERLLLERVLRTKHFTEFLALMKSIDTETANRNKPKPS